MGMWTQPTLSTHLVKVVLNVQDLLGQQSQATEQHGGGLMNHRQVDQPGGQGRARVSVGTQVRKSGLGSWD